jgi:hypothetical protein
MGLLTIAFMSVAFAAGQRGLLAMVAAEPAPVHRTPDASTQGPPVLDLAAMVIRRSDLTGDWVQANGGMDVVEVPWTIGRAGRRYWNVIKLPRPADWNRPRQAIGTNLWAFASAGDATTLFNRVERELDQEGYERFAEVPTIGDAVDVRHGFCGCAGTKSPAVTVVFREGTLVAQIDLSDFAPDESPFSGTYQLTAAVIADFGRIMAGRMADVSAQGPGTGLGTAVLRLGDDSARFETVNDDYLRLDNVDLPQYFKDRAESDHFNDGFGDATDVYWYAMHPANNSVWYSTYLYGFPTEESASAWFARTPAAVNSFGKDVEIVADTSGHGDESLTVRFGYGKGNLQFVRTYVRVGDVVASIDVGAYTAPSMDAVDILVSAQTDCLQNGQCLTILPIPDQL